MSSSKLIDANRDTRFLDGLRGLAAFEVLVGHARWLLSDGVSNALNRLPPTAYLQRGLLYALGSFRFGHEAVIFFFVLSGFVIHIRYAKALAKDPSGARFDYREFFWRRAKRIYPAFLFSLLLCWIVDSLGQAQGYAIYSASTPYPVINENLTVSHGLATLAGNVAFLMGTYVPMWGTNGPLWSLKFEWWFYVIYPTLWWIFRRSIGVAFAIMVILCAASWFSTIWPVLLLQQVFSKMVIWWLGVILAEMYAGRLAVRFRTVSPLALALPLAAVLHLSDLYWGVGFFGLIAAGFALQESGRKLWPLNMLKWLGDMSFTLYVCHLPVLVLASGWLMSRNADHKLPSQPFFALTAVLLCVVGAWLLHLAVEKPFITRKRAVQEPGARIDSKEPAARV